MSFSCAKEKAQEQRGGYNRRGLCERLILDEKTGCWNFSGHKNEHGYGHLWAFGKLRLAHVLAAHLWLGYDFSSSLRVLHRCDNPQCFNPKHLFIGTLSDNSVDSVVKKRHAFSKRTHCVNGHEFSEENTRMVLNKTSGRMVRLCKKCDSKRNKRYRLGEKSERKVHFVTIP